jgi:hypothetical protein
MDKAAAGLSGLAPADEADAARSGVEVGFVGAGLALADGAPAGPALADGAPAGPALADGAPGRSEVEGAGPALRRRRQHCHQTRTPTPRTITPPPPAPPPTAVLMTDQHRPSWASRRPPGLCTQGPTANEHCREEQQKVNCCSSFLIHCGGVFIPSYRTPPYIDTLPIKFPYAALRNTNTQTSPT